MVTSKIQREKGYGHWIWQRISAVFTFFLSIYLTYLITSIGALDYTSAHSFVATPHQGVALALKSGTDMNCGGQYEKHLYEAYEIGLVSEIDIDTSLKRILRSMKLSCGISAAT